MTDRPKDRPTDHATSVTIGRIYVCSTAMRLSNNLIDNAHNVEEFSNRRRAQSPAGGPRRVVFLSGNWLRK